MSATVISMSNFCGRLLRRPKSETELACERIRRELRGQCTEQRIAQAEARAARLIAANLAPDRAVRRAIAWATCATDPTDPPPLAA